MNIGKIVYISLALLLFLFIMILSLPKYLELFLISLFLLITSYLLLVKKNTNILSISINTPLTDTGKKILFISGISTLIAGIFVFIQGIFNLFK
ncbi:hypothetical protein [Enterococcus termitis]|uniref:Uncharacterized protein n=1 Tax=Enterococcus termitis TaxID=332950 RepID=A0A1E5GAY2_9ENTE|nr:hypothetical protein [Enterococcus termitis]OEG09864.1 hypothetical protein BCR25_10190 [Enterococcus termitis]